MYLERLFVVIVYCYCLIKIVYLKETYQSKSQRGLGWMPSKVLYARVLVAYITTPNFFPVYSIFVVDFF